MVNVDDKIDDIHDACMKMGCKWVGEGEGEREGEREMYLYMKTRSGNMLR